MSGLGSAAVSGAHAASAADWVETAGGPAAKSRQGWSGSPLDGLRQEHASAVPLERHGALRRGEALSGLINAVAGCVGGSRGRAAAASNGVPLNTLRQPSRSSAPYYERCEMPTHAEAIARLRCDAKLASYPYHRDVHQLPRPWSPETFLSEDTRRELGLRHDGVENYPGAIVDRDSGLTAVLLHNSRTDELVLAFGGTTAGKKTGETLGQRSKPGRNFMSTLSQWGANLYAGVGGTPKSYRQAATILAAVQRRMAEDPKKYGGHTLRVVGHSKGGGEAMYASLKSAQPVEVTAFCPSHLSDGLLKELPKENLDRAKELVSSFSPKGDPVAGLRGKLIGLHGVGKGHHFEGVPGSSMMNLHDQFHRHVEHFCDQSASRHGAR